MSFILMMALMGAEPAAGSPNPLTAKVTELRECIIGKARKWAKGPDPARDIAVAARQACAALENEVREMTVNQSRFDDPRKQQLWITSANRLADGLLEGFENAAMREVIEARGS